MNAKILERCFLELCAKYTFGGDPAPGDNVPVSFELITEWAQRCEASEKSLLDCLAVRLARGFADEKIGYELGDSIANDLYAVCLDKRIGDFPFIFWSVFAAFDAGEFHRSADQSDDPVSEQTMPLIKDLLAKLDG